MPLMNGLVTLLLLQVVQVLSLLTSSKRNFSSRALIALLLESKSSFSSTFLALS
jgi:hypothetical protein